MADKIATRESYGAALCKLAEKYGVSRTMLERRCRLEHWAAEREAAKAKVQEKVIQKTAEAAADNVVTAERIKGRLLEQLEALIEEKFIAEADPEKLADAAADAMVKATGDRWSYYIPADEYQAYQEQMANAYVGVGITIQQEKEILMMVVEKEIKDKVLNALYSQMGMGKHAKGIAFSLPVSDVAGLVQIPTTEE